MVQCQPERAVCLRAVRQAAVIFFPGRFVGVLLKVFRARPMMLTVHHAAEP